MHTHRPAHTCIAGTRSPISSVTSSMGRESSSWRQEASNSPLYCFILTNTCACQYLKLYGPQISTPKLTSGTNTSIFLNISELLRTYYLFVLLFRWLLKCCRNWHQFPEHRIVLRKINCSIFCSVICMNTNCTPTHTHTYTHSHLHTHTYTHIYTHTLVPLW